ncbi:hypothetical protein MLD38_031735 [Melastoma candidum]|uniref:Uncharacterized protein n=1 Tax=Melastoma candidum TaxID=119954 RepID=A0ACB9MS27_9MYRT|nr:hypothetical protein MLD38_031735 [Melastoma candidum]
MLVETGADKTFEDNIDGNLTVFCSGDTTLDAFAPKYKNLTKAQKASLALYHSVPFYESMQILKSNNGLMNTLATDSTNKYDFTVQNDGEDVTLETKVVTLKVTGTVIDEDPLVIYKVDKVLQPKELFKAVAAPTPKASKGKAAAEANSPAADSPRGISADQTTDKPNGAGVNARLGFGLVLGLVLSVVFV